MRPASSCCATSSLTTYNYLLFGIILAIMMIKRPEGLFPVESAKAEMHGIGVAAEVTAAAADELGRRRGARGESSIEPPMRTGCDRRPTEAASTHAYAARPDPR